MKMNAEHEINELKARIARDELLLGHAVATIAILSEFYKDQTGEALVLPIPKVLTPKIEAASISLFKSLPSE